MSGTSRRNETRKKSIKAKHTGQPSWIKHGSVIYIFITLILRYAESKSYFTWDSIH